MRTLFCKSNDSAGALPNYPANRPRHKSRLQEVRRQVLAGLTAILLASSTLLVQVEAAEGDLDATFGSGGKVTTGFIDFGFDGASAVAVQTDGKIVAAGIAFNPNGEPVIGLVRYDTNGNLDQTFGSNGKAMTQFTHYDLFEVDVAIQNDGMIVVVGAAGPVSVPGDFGLARFDTNGNPDPTFGAGGEVTTDFFGQFDEPTSVAIQSDGKILVAGSATNVDFSTDFALARYNANGDLDATFGSGGKLTTDFFGLSDKAEDVAIQNDGKIVAAGTVVTSGINTDFGLVRYDGTGNLDPAFGNGGKVTTDASSDYYDAGYSVVIQSDGKIVVAGTAVNNSNIDFALLRYNGDGTLDSNFGSGGKVTTDFFGGPDRAFDVVLQGDGKIVAVGSVNNDPSDVERFNDFGVARYDTSGSLDQTFGVAGKVTTDFLHSDFAESVAIQPDCKIVVAGFSWPLETGDSDFALARYDSGGCPVAPLPCPLSQGFWKNNPGLWPVDTLTLGSQAYTKSELLAILNTSTQTDASLILARQLIAAKLNLANGSDSAPISGTIADADALLSGYSGKLPYKVKPSSVIGQSMTADASVLNDYNNALLTPGCAP